MAAPLLSTKLSIPWARRGLVPRPGLVDLLAKGLEGPLTLVCAPAGFGKTTLLAEWSESDYARNTPMAWLSLDRGDNDVATFWEYFIGALQTLQAEIGETALSLLQSTEPSSTESALLGLINELAEISNDFVVVLDDYHVIDAPGIHDAMEFVLDHLPPRMHLVMLSRADPRLPLPRLRVGRRLSEIRAADLRFTQDDAASFLNGMMSLDLSSDDVAALHTRTEGWAAGLQLAGLSLEGRSDKHEFISAFSGSHHYLVDYLLDEVLSRQPKEVYDFLCQSSVLERFSAPLCAAVMGTPDSQRILEHVERANLFLVPLDDDRLWYRYHHLFADVLTRRLQDENPGLIDSLHRQASSWFEKEGLIDEAIQYAVAAQDDERAANLMGFSI